MNKCPCEDCLVLVMCKGSKLFNLIPKCDRLLNYVRNERCAMKAIKIIVPPYYVRRKEKGTLSGNAHQILIRADEILHNRDKSYKKRIW